MRSISLIAYGVLVGALLTAPLMGVFYLGEQLADLSFPPFDVFDWLARTLPGDVISRSIDTMVKSIDTLELGETSSTAKTLETLAALATFFGGGLAACALAFGLLHALRARRGALRSRWPGALLGLVIGLPVILVSQDIAVFEVSPAVNVVWLAALFAAWGASALWVFERLATLTPMESMPVEGGEPVVTARALSRRQFLVRVGSATATLTVAGAAVGRYLEVRDERAYQQLVTDRREAAEAIAGTVMLPNKDDPVMPAPGTRPEYTPLEDHYRIDINVRPAEIDPATWRLRIHGQVKKELNLSLDELTGSFTSMDQYVTLACISNPVGGDLTSTTRWTGVSLRDILEEAGLKATATHLKITSADGFYETVAINLIYTDRRVMLTYNWDGIPLLHKHGFPLRIYIPDRYGMKQPKWITDIEVVDRDEDGYWVARGWDKEAIMKATSVIDVVAADMTYEQDGLTYVPVGGIAHAGARGIGRVEVRVDDGEWVEAQLRQPLSDTTWVIWRYDWPFEAGRHTFEVRCTESDGTPQIESRRSSHPSGATGIHQRVRTL